MAWENRLEARERKALVPSPEAVDVHVEEE